MLQLSSRQCLVALEIRSYVFIGEGSRLLTTERHLDHHNKTRDINVIGAFLSLSLDCCYDDGVC